MSPAADGDVLGSSPPDTSRRAENHQIFTAIFPPLQETGSTNPTAALSQDTLPDDRTTFQQEVLPAFEPIGLSEKLTDVWKILSAVLRCSNVLFDSVDDGQTPPTCLNQQVRAMVIGDTSAGAAGFTSRFSRFGGSWRAGHFCYTEVIL